MGFHKPVFGQAILGGTVHRVMTASDSDVAVFVDRDLKSAKNILAPFLGGKHDRLALDLAGRIARNADASLTILHVVPPHRTESDAVLHARTVVEKTFSDPTQPTPVNFQVIEDASPVEAVIQAARQYDLVVIGVEEQWGMQSQLFGFRPERIARETTDFAADRAQICGACRRRSNESKRRTPGGEGVIRLARCASLRSPGCTSGATSHVNILSIRLLEHQLGHDILSPH